MSAIDIRSIFQEVELIQTVELEEEISRSDFEAGLRSRHYTLDHMGYDAGGVEEGRVYRNNSDGSQDVIGTVLAQRFGEDMDAQFISVDDDMERGEDDEDEDE